MGGDSGGDSGGVSGGGAAAAAPPRPGRPSPAASSPGSAPALCSRPSLSGGGLRGRFWEEEASWGLAAESDSSGGDDLPPAPRSPATLGDFLAGARRSPRVRRAFAPGGRGSRFSPHGAAASSPRGRASRCRPAVASPVTQVRRPLLPTSPPSPLSQPATELPGGTPESAPPPAAVRPSGDALRAGALPIWAGPAVGPAFFPVGVATSSGASSGVGGWRAGLPALTLTASPGRGPGCEAVRPSLGPAEATVQPLKWWWIPRGARDLGFAFPASTDDVRRLGGAARRIVLSSPPAPLSATFAQVLMAGAAPPPSGGAGGGRVPQPAGASGGAGRRHGPVAPGAAAAQPPPAQPRWFVERERKREAKRRLEAAAAAAAAANPGAAAAPPAVPAANLGGAGVLGRAAGKAPAVPTRRPPPIRPSAAAPVSGTGGPSASQAPCFKCGQVGHFQSACLFAPDAAELQLMGQAIPGEGFFYLDFEEGESMVEEDSNEAIITLGGSGLPISALEAELRHLVEGAWDWKVREVGPMQFSVSFPSKDLLKMSVRSGRLFLPLNNLEAAIRLADSDPAPVVVLQEAWVTITGLPRRMRTEARLLAGMRMLGRHLEVDARTLANRLPVRMRIACRDPSKLNGYAQIFHKNEGFNVGIRVDQPWAAPSAPPPAPPTDHDSSGDDSLNEEWRAASEKDKQTYSATPLPGSSEPAAGGGRRRPARRGRPRPRRRRSSWSLLRSRWLSTSMAPTLPGLVRGLLPSPLWRRCERGVRLWLRPSRPRRWAGGSPLLLRASRPWRARVHPLPRCLGRESWRRSRRRSWARWRSSSPPPRMLWVGPWRVGPGLGLPRRA